MPRRPPIEELFFDLIQSVDKVESRHGQNEALRKIIEPYGLSHATYLGVNIPSLTEKDLYFVTTYSDVWCEHYVREKFEKVDPIVRLGFGGILPFDWRDVGKQNKKVARFFGEAAEHGVGSQGLSFPIRGVHGETALFSINSHMSDREWETLKRTFMRDFQIFAYHYHTHVLTVEGVKFEVAELSVREVECLKWAAAGKTIWETAAILNIADTTVKFYLENARAKLGVVNTTQAVAKAIQSGLLQSI